MGIIVLSTAVVCSLLLLWWSPFPYWPSYRAALQSVMNAETISWSQKLNLLVYLMRDLARFQVLSWLWFIDEMLFRAYRKAPVQQPIFIVGQPRNGTTFLHRTLSGESKFLSLKHLEWKYPSIAFWRVLDLFGLRSWVERIHYWPGTTTGKMARKMHEHRLGSFEEHGIFFEEMFYHHYFVFRRYPFPELLGKVTDFHHLVDQDRRRMLDVFKRVVQKALYYRGEGCIWLTKENESVELYEMMAEAFPDARYIFIARSPEEFIDSYVNLSKTSTKAKTEIDPTTINEWYDRNLDFRKVECLRMIEFEKKISETNKTVAISYRQFTTDIMGTVSYIFEQLDLEMSDAYSEKLRELVAKQKTRNRGYDNESNGIEGFDFYASFVAEIETARRQNQEAQAV